MTQSSLFWTTSGNGDGVVAGYLPEQIWALLRALFGGDGVALDYLSELAASLAGGTVTVAPGAALVSGIPYTADADVPINIPDPTAQSRYDFIVLRASWQAQTVRAVRLAGVEGVLSAPTLTQQRGGVYEMPLALVGVGCIRTISANTTISDTIYIESLEVINGSSLEVISGASVVIEAISGLTDARTFLQAVHSITESNFAASAVATAKIADNAVPNTKLLDMAQATVMGRVSSGSGDPEAVTMAQLIALLATTTPDRLIDAVTTLSANWTVEWIEVANGYSLEISSGVALTLADGGWTGFDADTVDGSQAAALAMHSHAHSTYSPVSHAHSSYSPVSHAHSTYASASHTHGAYSPATHTHSDYAAAAHSHGTVEIDDNAVVNSALADMAEATVKGRAHGSGTGDPGDMTAAQVVDMLITLNGVADGIDADLLDSLHAAELATATHTHSAYATATHTHSTYAAPTHTHSTYAAPAHTHSTYAAPTHTHSTYAAPTHTHSGISSTNHVIGNGTTIVGSAISVQWQNVVLVSGTVTVNTLTLFYPNLVTDIFLLAGLPTAVSVMRSAGLALLAGSADDFVPFNIKIQAGSLYLTQLSAVWETRSYAFSIIYLV